MSSKRPVRARILRQPFENRLSHWLVALSTFVLFVTGMGQMPMYQRYGIASLPGLQWTADFRLTLTLHYAAGALLFFGVVFHLTHALLLGRFAIFPRRGDVRESVQIIAAMLGRGEEPASHKYLAEQRLAYAFIGSNTLVVLASGIVKVAKNLPQVQLDAALVWTATHAHNVSALLLFAGIAGHFAAFVFKANRALLPAMVDGHVDRHYAEERHGLWYEEVADRES